MKVLYRFSLSGTHFKCQERDSTVLNDVIALSMQRMTRIKGRINIRCIN
jgi:hypothetical protein